MNYCELLEVVLKEAHGFNMSLSIFFFLFARICTNTILVLLVFFECVTSVSNTAKMLTKKKHNTRKLTREKPYQEMVSIEPEPSMFECGNVKIPEGIRFDKKKKGNNEHIVEPSRRIELEDSNGCDKKGWNLLHCLLKTGMGRENTSEDLNFDVKNDNLNNLPDKARKKKLVSYLFENFSKPQIWSKVVTTLLLIKGRVFGFSNCKPTLQMRSIPISIGSKNANEYFNHKFYSDEGELTNESSGFSYCSNAITSSKYSLLNFLPKQLHAQFSKVANCYFMVVSIMQLVPTWSTTGNYTTIVPLLIFMSISVAREAFDDWKRHRNDKEENNQLVSVLRENEDLCSYDAHSIATIMTQIIPDVGDRMVFADDHFLNKYDHENALKRYNLQECRILWKDVQVGDIVLIKENEWVPADIVLLSSSDKKYYSYFETMALDGETNLKLKQPHPVLSRLYSSTSNLKSRRELINVENPNKDLYNFRGLFSVDGKTCSLTLDNVAFRGSVLRNTRSALGIVIFTGEETKIRMNNVKNPRTKRPKLQRNINCIVVFMVSVVVILSTFSSMGQFLSHKKYQTSAWYLRGRVVGVMPTIIGFIIMYNSLIPLSLYVTMEIIKLVQLILMQYDIDMYHVETDTPAEARTATILEELGQVSYVFSDKTGTLTENNMVFRKFSLNGVSWLYDLDKRAESMRESNEHIISREGGSSIDKKQNGLSHITRSSVETNSIALRNMWKSTAYPHKDQEIQNALNLLKYVQLHPHTDFAQNVVFFFLAITLCNTCLPRDKTLGQSAQDQDAAFSDSKSEICTEDSVIEYQGPSSDELALVGAARDLGFVLFERNENTLTIKTYPNGFEKTPLYETFEILDVIDFSSSRKRMSVIVKMPDNRICLFCKGADNILLDKLKNPRLAKKKEADISIMSSEKKAQEADIIIGKKFSQEYESKKSISSLGGSVHVNNMGEPLDVMKSIDKYLINKNDERKIEDIARQARLSLHSEQIKRFSLDGSPYIPDNKTCNSKDKTFEDIIPAERLVRNEDFIIEKTLEHLNEFSTEGLRTLIYTYKWLDRESFNQWLSRYREAKAALTNRSRKIEDCGSEIESGMEILGCTAIEDKLQEGVNDTIEKLRRAGIKVWMLTGDKRETAINIGYSCSLVKDYSTLIVLKGEEGKNAIHHNINSASECIRGGGVAHSVMVIDGLSLSMVEEEEDLNKLFVDLCILVDSAICCRVSPSQKASMVSTVRHVKKDCVTLAIGDGANDVAMIQRADIGVGLAGREGMQASKSADYSIAQFRFLLKLLLVNGRYNYVRTCKFVLCTFYKEFLFYLTQMIFQRYTLFSGTSLYESWSLSMFNTLFTSLCVLCVGMFDKDLKASTLLLVPELYEKGRLYQAFNLRIFLLWMLLAAVQSLGVSFLGYVVWGFNALKDNTIFPLGTLVYASLIIIINIKCSIIEMQNRSWLCFAAFIISVGGYGMWNFIIMLLFRKRSSPIYFVDFGLYHFGSDQSWWASLLILFTIPLLLDILFRTLKFYIWPSNDDIFKIYEKAIEMRRLFENETFGYLNQGWTFKKEESTWERLYSWIGMIIKKSLRSSRFFGYREGELSPRISVHGEGTVTNSNESKFGAPSEIIYTNDSMRNNSSNCEILPSGKMLRKHGRRWRKVCELGNKMVPKFKRDEFDLEDSEIDAVIDKRLKEIRDEESIYQRS